MPHAGRFPRGRGPETSRSGRRPWKCGLWPTGSERHCCLLKDLCARVRNDPGDEGCFRPARADRRLTRKYQSAHGALVFCSIGRAAGTHETGKRGHERSAASSKTETFAARRQLEGRVLARGGETSILAGVRSSSTWTRNPGCRSTRPPSGRARRSVESRASDGEKRGHRRIREPPAALSGEPPYERSTTQALGGEPASIIYAGVSDVCQVVRRRRSSAKHYDVDAFQQALADRSPNRILSPI